MRTRTTVIVAAVTAALLAGGVSPSAAESERAAATKAVAGRMLVAPRPEALVKHLPVRVVVRAPRQTSRLRVELGRRDVTARFRRSGGSLRVARLTRRDGLRYGHNHLSVLAQRRGGRPVVEARSFVLARRDADLVRLRIRPAPVTSLNVRVAGAPSLAPEHFGQPGEVEGRLAAIRRERTVRVWLNGRRVTRAVDRSRPTRWTASLSATHGLRHGVNRLRIQVVEPDRGRYALLRRRFVVRRDRHLAAAGWDIATRVGGRVQLDGRRSRTIRGGRPHHSWRIVSKPRGSRAVLRRAGAARPLLAPDRPGRYVVGLTVTDGARRATASQATPSSTDTVEVTAGPSSLLVPFKGLAYQGGRSGIQVGDTFYPNPPASGNALRMQWLTLDRATLTPTKTGNSWFDGSGSGDHGLGALTSALSIGGLDQLVILSFTPKGSAGPAVQPDQVDGFNRALKTIGVGSIDTDILTRGDFHQLAIVGVPSGGDGSGWSTMGGTLGTDALTGWLMPDSTLESSRAFRFRFQPERPAFDTSSSSTPTTNTMTLRGQRIDATLPAGYSGGFQVVWFDPNDFTVFDHAVFGTNAPSLDPRSQRQAMALFLDPEGANRAQVAVQSIGHVEPGGEPDAWRDVSRSLAAYSANPHTFNTVDGSYAFIGGPQLDKGEVAESSSAIVTDPTATPPTRESGTLRGRARIRADGYFMPAAADAAKSLDFPLYDMVFTPATRWPYTPGGAFPQQVQPNQVKCPPPGNDTAAYAAALAWISGKIERLKSYAPNLRQAYLGNDNLTYSDMKQDLGGLSYPGDGKGFGKAEFCNLQAELQLEFDWLDATQTLFGTGKDALNRSGNHQLVDLQTIGDKIRKAVAPPDGANIVSPTLRLMQGLVGLLPGAGQLSAAVGVLASAYDLANAIASDEKGAPVGERISTEVDVLAQKVADNLSGAAGGLDRLREVVISDYGRLKALGSVADGPGWHIDPTDAASNLTTAADAYFSSELLPVAYDVWYLAPGTNHNPTADNCWIYGQYWFRGAPATAQLQFNGDFNGPDGRVHGGLWVLGHDPLPSFNPPPWYPPAALTDSMFHSVTQSGYGIQLPRFLWTQYKAPPTQTYRCYN
jgi:hypothetical protein